MARNSTCWEPHIVKKIIELLATLNCKPEKNQEFLAKDNLIVINHFGLTLSKHRTSSTKSRWVADGVPAITKEYFQLSKMKVLRQVVHYHIQENWGQVYFFHVISLLYSSCIIVISKFRFIWGSLVQSP